MKIEQAMEQEAVMQLADLPQRTIDAIKRDAIRPEHIARRYNTADCKVRMNQWLNSMGIYMTRTETWPTRPPTLNLFKPEGA